LYNRTVGAEIQGQSGNPVLQSQLKEE
jgi:hypothetical protein